MSTHPPLSPSHHHLSLSTQLPPVPPSPVHLPAPRPIRFASFQGPWPVSVTANINAGGMLRPPLGNRTQSFDPAERLRDAFAGMNFADGTGSINIAEGQIVSPTLTPSPSSPPDYLLELLSIFGPPRPSLAHSDSYNVNPSTHSLPTLPSHITSTTVSMSSKIPTPPPRPSAPFRHRRHPSATSLLLEAREAQAQSAAGVSSPDGQPTTTAEPGSRGRKGAEVPYWKPTVEARRRRSGQLRRSTSESVNGNGSGSDRGHSGTGSPTEPTLPEQAQSFISPHFLALTPSTNGVGPGTTTAGSSTPVSPPPLTPAAAYGSPAMPTPVSMEADPRVLGLQGFPFPHVHLTHAALHLQSHSHAGTPLREECVPLEASPDGVPAPTSLPAPVLTLDLEHAHGGQLTCEPDEMLSPRAFLLQEMQAELLGEALAMPRSQSQHSQHTASEGSGEGHGLGLGLENEDTLRMQEQEDMHDDA